MPKVSVIIPTYNRASLLRDAIDSVLHQTFTDLELVVVDDGSTDNTEEVLCSITDPRVRYFKQPNRGVSAARNAGIQATTSEFVAFLDSDDLFLPERISIQMTVIDHDPDVGLVYCLFYSTKNGGPKKLQGKCYPSDLRLLAEGANIPFSTILMQRSWLEQLGGFDEKLVMAEDRELIFRLFMAGCRMTCVPQPLVIIRWQKIGLSRDIHRYTDSDSMAYLEKIFNDPRLPSDLLALQNSVSAKHLIIKAASAYLASEVIIGQDMLRRAIAVDPALADQNIDPLVNQFVNFIIGHSPDNPENVLRLVMQHLPGDRLFARRFERQLRHKFYVEAAFEAYRSGRRLKCKKYAFLAFINNIPSALRNHGLLLMLIRP